MTLLDTIKISSKGRNVVTKCELTLLLIENIVKHQRSFILHYENKASNNEVVA